MDGACKYAISTAEYEDQGLVLWTELASMLLVQ